MNEIEEKHRIQAAIQSFTETDLSNASLDLFTVLGYNTERQNPFSEKTFSYFMENFLEGSAGFNEAKALTSEWNYVDLLFQLSDNELTTQTSIFDSKKVIVSGDSKTAMESYLFFVIGLSAANYTRTGLSLITREINKVFAMPVMVLFRYGQSITLAVINRRLNKRDEQKDVLKKVTLIKDINIQNPHRAHLEILHDLSLNELLKKYKFTDFSGLHEAWQKTLDIKELNKRFYQELANWYFWAMDHVSFPDDIEKDKSIRNATSLIRLITRIIFIWFIKEKGLVPDILFDKVELKKILKEFAQDHNSKSYYNAILQNLFFGTLNQKMDERGFAKEGHHLSQINHYGVKNLFRYADQFTIGEKEALELFKEIPFLNGGLFDCLDKEDETGKVIYMDGFSRNPKKQAIVPDFLFFSPEQEYDLNAVYGTKNKKYRIKGLIDILSGYKFTITENTPIEEEIALDPELLGKVFENLLASYNPETQTTARKQTGSFYTPREIVNYMVDESLKAYLKQCLINNSPPAKEGWLPKADGVVPAKEGSLPKTAGAAYLGVSNTDNKIRINNLPELKTLRRQLRSNLTPSEAMLWTYLQNSKLEGRKFRRQHSIDKYILDFYCPSEKLGIELDGEAHNTETQAEYDRERDLFLNTFGIKILRFENKTVFENLDGLLKVVKDNFGWEDRQPPIRVSGGTPVVQEPPRPPSVSTPPLKGGELLLEAKLDDLFSYNENEPCFSPEQRQYLIQAIDSCKILDPACGSGAFPMGILHKLVHILHKLDPKNEQWKERQLQKARLIDDPAIRNRLIEDIESAFENNELDYGRKLYLIENCIYGLDIQPIAVQIAKLRFFISLVVDQRKQPDKENYGVRSLPNLETKFVAANTLMGLEKQIHLFKKREIAEFEEKLKELRHSYFSARTRREKINFQKKDKEIRKQIAELLTKDGWEHKTADMIVSFDPYDQNASSAFFDPEWMFGITDGFDIVIANPPYIRHEAIKDQKPQLLKQFGKFYCGTADIYTYFYKTGINLLKPSGHLCFIAPNKFWRAGYGRNTRILLTSEATPRIIIDFCDLPIFDATTYPSVLLLEKRRPSDKERALAVTFKTEEQLTRLDETIAETGFKMPVSALKSEGWNLEQPAILALMEKLRKAGVPLGEYVNGNIYYGIKTGLNDAFVIDAATREALISADPKSEELIKPWLRGRDIKKWKADWAGLYVIFTRHGVEIDKYPVIKKYLEKYREDLEPKNTANAKRGRKPGPYKWYEIQDNIVIVNLKMYLLWSYESANL